MSGFGQGGYGEPQYAGMVGDDAVAAPLNDDAMLAGRVGNAFDPDAFSRERAAEREDDARRTKLAIRTASLEAALRLATSNEQRICSPEDVTSAAELFHGFLAADQ